MKYGIWKYMHKNKPIHIIRIYHPPPSMTNNTSNAMFVDDLTELITKRVPNQQNAVILGDFNIHMDKLEDNGAITLNNTIEAIGLKQHISGPTHKVGNTLDLIFTKIMSELKTKTHSKHALISDHCIVSIEVNISKPQHQRTNNKAMNTTTLTKEAMMGNFHPPIIESSTSLSEAYNQF